jgi:hypothetical protein
MPFLLRPFAALLGFVLPVAAIAQHPAPIPQIQADAQTVLTSLATAGLFPATKLEFPKFDTFPTEITTTDIQLFRTVQYMKATRPTGQNFQSVQGFMDKMLRDGAVSREEGAVLEAFARNTPLTIALSPDDGKKPVQLVPKLAEAESAQLRQLMASSPVLSSVQIIQARYAQPGTAREWLKLYAGTPDQKAVAVAVLRLAFLQFASTATPIASYSHETIRNWYAGLDAKELRELFTALHEDMVAVNTTYSPAIFPEYALKYTKEAAEGKSAAGAR